MSRSQAVAMGGGIVLLAAFLGLSILEALVFLSILILIGES